MHKDLSIYLSISLSVYLSIYLYFLIVAGLLLFVFSLQYILCHNYVCHYCWVGEAYLSVKTIDYLEPSKPCAWAWQESVCGLVFLSSACWWWPRLVLIFEFHLKIVTSFWPPGPRKVFWAPILRGLPVLAIQTVACSDPQISLIVQSSTGRFWWEIVYSALMVWVKRKRLKMGCHWKTALQGPQTLL